MFELIIDRIDNTLMIRFKQKKDAGESLIRLNRLVKFESLLFRAKSLLAFSLMFLEGKKSYGQTDLDTGSMVSTMAFSVACMVVLILGWIIMRRISGRRRETLDGVAGLDLMELRKKNLLTPEELAMVSGALARRMAEKDASKQKLAAAPKPGALLNDPDVRRLEAMALASKSAEDQTRSDTTRVSDPGSNFTPPKELKESDTEPEESLDDIILPLDVQQLADAGILTPEEVENVKRRLKARG